MQIVTSIGIIINNIFIIFILNHVFKSFSSKKIFIVNIHYWFNEVYDVEVSRMCEEYSK